MISTLPRSPQSMSDEDLCVSYRTHNDHQLIAELYQRYGHLAYGACLKYLKNKADAQDVLSTIFEKLISKLKETEISNFNAWLYTVIRSECMMKLRTSNRYNHHKDQFKILEEEESYIPDYGDKVQLDIPTEEVANEEELAIEAIKHLKPEQRTCVQLFYFKDKSYKEISSLTGFSEKKVKSHLQNGKRNIKQFIEKYLQDDS